MSNSQRPSRLVRLILRLDQAGSFWFIPIALVTAPALVFMDPGRIVVTLVWSVLAGYALWLGLLGVFMAIGLTLSMARGVEFPDRWWETMLKYDPKSVPGESVSGITGSRE
ncbi:hypothetical protein [Antrihabitans cavernicola]|uniref:Uncharacterized protein n=1 Tax=Antrihabitans cavernicola TaxID=2495913 RepID=A0A5A7S3M6_9NOCA|nr:hypothetical protein [Spelaeibacter cavernicola]KAA0017365.1 hypothetical protein FOY51_25020 [Spelaeibacter cavernicola]